MFIKRITSVLIILVMAAALCSCGKSSKGMNAFVQDPDYTYKGDGMSGFPDLKKFKATTLDEGSFTPEDLSSKDVTIVNMWATWCGPCRQELPELAEFAAKLPDNVGFITICSDGSEDPAKTRSILESVSYKGKTVISGSGDVGNLMSALMYVPTTVFVDSSGTILQVIVGSPNENLAGNYLAVLNRSLEAAGHERIELPGVTEAVSEG